ncbi:efflux transporter outer membrane subunit [Thiomicrorhabdus sp. Kp2]|uniref:efflux transporter outer membrane subunit n=1 Tax=Thiomicrorhabdus sp. Kp2 TaxID=1123518 RepID=UPI000422CE24|nr:efflux transporter outer membrane subunit [Thiomicrorhabdus sp. Kp2]
MFKRLILVTVLGLPFAGLASLSGCSTPTREAPIIQDIPSQWDTQNKQKQASTSEASQQTTKWWLSLNDPILNDLIEQALKANPDLLSALSSIKEARAYRIQTEGALYPSLTIGANGSRTYSNRTDITSDNFSLGLDASWEPDIFGQNSKTYSSSQALAKASQMDYADMAVSLTTEVANTYIALRNAQAQKQLTQKTLSSWQETIELTSWQAKAGLVSELDVVQANRSYEQTKSTIPSFDATIQQSQYELALLLGKTPTILQSTLKNPGVLPKIPNISDIPIPANVLLQRPDVKADEQRVLSAMALTDSAKANQLPGFTLGGNIGLDGNTLAKLFSIDSWVSGLSAGIVQTLFDHGQLQAQVDIKHEQEVQAILTLRSTILSALKETQEALSNVQLNKRTLASLNKALLASEEEVKLSTLLYESGQADFFTVLTAQRTLLSLRQQYLTAETNSLNNITTLTQSIMGGWAIQQSQQVIDKANNPSNNEPDANSDHVSTQQGMQK